MQPIAVTHHRPNTSSPQSISSISILILSSHLHLRLPSVFFPFRLKERNFALISRAALNVPHIPPPPPPPPPLRQSHKNHERLTKKLYCEIIFQYKNESTCRKRNPVYHCLRVALARQHIIIIIIIIISVVIFPLKMKRIL